MIWDHYIPQDFFAHYDLIKSGAKRIANVQRIGWGDALSESVHLIWECLGTFNPEKGEFSRYFKRSVVLKNVEFLKRRKASRLIDWPVNEDGELTEYPTKSIAYDQEEWGQVIKEIAQLPDELKESIQVRLDKPRTRRLIRMNNDKARGISKSLGGKKSANNYQKALRILRSKFSD